MVRTSQGTSAPAARQFVPAGPACPVTAPAQTWVPAGNPPRGRLAFHENDGSLCLVEMTRAMGYFPFFARVGSRKKARFFMVFAIPALTLRDRETYHSPPPRRGEP